jgi:hypothetical protein
MKIKQIAAVLGGAMVMACAGSAGAGTLYNGTTTSNAGATSSYNVSVYEDSIWNFHVNSISANPTALNVTTVEVIFFTKANEMGGIASTFTTLDAGTNSGSPTSWTNWGTGHTIIGGGVMYQNFAGTSSTAIQGAGTNMFAQQTGPGHGQMGYFNLVSNNAKSFEVLLETGTTSYYVDKFNISDFSTPEASTFALLLPGLVPLGIALRRRRAARP